MNQRWRPRALQKPTLVSFTGLCVALFIANELVTFGCKRRDGCHIFGNSPDGNLPTLSTFVYTTIPTILGIILSLRWYVTHHDIIRLEPYYQMSTKCGVKASMSLFLQYSYDVVFFLPFKALMKRHYIVALSSSILLMMNYALVPLMGTIFDDSIISFSIFGNASRIEFNTSALQLPANFTYAAYDYAWAHGGGTLPPFMTEECALLPVELVGSFSGFRPGESWNVLTTLYDSDLECAEAHHISYNYSIWPDNTHRVIEIFRNDSSESAVRVCDALAQEKSDEASARRVMEYCRDMVSFVTPWTALYARLADDPSTFMFGWASGSSDYPAAELDAVNVRSPAPRNITAIFCTPKYYAQTVDATVSMPSGRVSADGIDLVGERKEIKALDGFPEAMDGGPVSGPDIGLVAINVEKPDRMMRSNPYPLRFGYPPNDLLNLKNDLLERFGRAARPVRPTGFATSSESNINMIVTNSLMAFALYSRQNDTLGDMLDPKELEVTIRKALKLWFAFAMSAALKSAVDTGISATTTIPVERKVTKLKITVNQYWSWGARMGLPLVAALTVLLIYLLEGRSCHLDAEPNTMAAALRLLSVSPILCAAIQHTEYYPLATLMGELDKRDFYFRLGLDQQGSPQIRLFHGYGENAAEVLETSEDLKVLEVPASTTQVQKDVQLVSPDLIATFSLVLFPVLIAALIATNSMSKKLDGFPMPGNPSSFWSKLLFGYLPVAFGMIAEALLILLGSTQSMMGPYKALVKKNATYAESINVDHDRIPPHFQVMRSFRSFRLGYYTLVVLSVTILLSNVLAVLMSGIFVNSYGVPMTKKPDGPLQMFTRARQDVFYRLNRRISSGYSPSWTTDDYYIDSPSRIAPIDGDATSTYETRSFGVNVSCALVPKERVTFPCSTSAQSTKARIPPECETYRYHDNVMFLNSPCGGSEVPIISFWNGTAADQARSHEGCPGFIFPLWAQNQRWTVDLADRTPAPPKSLGYNSSVFEFGTEDNYDFVVLNCSVTDLTAKVRANIRDGKVEDVVIELFDEAATPSLAHSFINVMTRLANEQGMYGPYAIQDINWLVAQVDPNVVQGSETHVPSSAAVAEPFAKVLKRLFPLLARQYAEEVFGVRYGLVDVMQYRVRVESVYFYVALGVLVFCFFVVVFTYINHAGKMMGHLPRSLAGLYSHLYASNAKNAIRPFWNGLENVEPEVVYAYGEYPEELGKHYGVYRIGEEALPSLTAEK